MYKKNKIKIVWLLAIVTTLGWLGSNFAQNKEKKKNSLRLNVTTSKKTYILGEQVDLQTSIKNIGNTERVINHLLTIESGYLQIFIAKNNGEFGRYLGPGWGIDERIARYELKPGDTVKDTNSLLWNHAPKVSHLNKRAAKEAQKGRVTTPYAFDNPGVHQIKTRLVLGKDIFESEEISIEIKEPAGDNLKIWNAIKDKPNLGFFIQKGAPRNYAPKEKLRVQRDIENLILQHPNGKIAKSMRKSLTMFAKQNQKN